MNVLVIGAGMYVTGRNESGVGTILSSLVQSSKNIDINKITIVARSDNNKIDVDDASKRINEILKRDIEVEYVALNGISLDEVCKKGAYDCAIVCTPDHLHFDQIVILFNNNIHVLSVKPLVATVEENKKLIKLQDEKKLIGMVEFHKRYDEANLYTKKVLTEKKLGDILYYGVDYTQKISIPTTTFKSWVEFTNIFQYLGVHYVDLFYFMTNYTPKKLMAYGTKGVLISKGINTYDSVHVNIIWEDKDGKESISVMNIGWVDPNCTSAMSDQKYKLVCTGGRIENDHKNRGVELVVDDIGIQAPNPYFSEYLLDENGDYEFVGYGHKSIKQFLLDVVNVNTGKVSLQSLEEIRPTFKQSLVSTHIVEAVNKSLDNVSNWEMINVEV
jgi:predicted dehydrogenase